MAERKNLNREMKKAMRKRGALVVGRKGWASRRGGTYAWRRKNRPAVYKVDSVFQHISVTVDSGAGRDNFIKDMLVLEEIGWQRFKSGISYNWAVDMKTGMIGEGMPMDAKGTHTVNNKNVPNFSFDQNKVARAIVVIGQPGDKLSDKAFEAIATILACMEQVGAITDSYDYKPHSFVAYKDCPCEPTRSKMPAIQKRAKFLLREGGTASRRVRAINRGKQVNIAFKALKEAKGRGKRKQHIEEARAAIEKIGPVN